MSYRTVMSRKAKNTLLLFVLLSALLFCTLDCLQTHRTSVSQASKNAVVGSDWGTYHSKSFRVIHVVDGDTIDIEHPDGDKEYTRLRLWGVDTPETKHPSKPVMYFGPESAAFTRELTEGQTVVLYLDEGNRTRCKYGRLLVYVQLPDGKILNEELISQGYAYADPRFQHRFKFKYEKLQSVAKRFKRGLWSEVTFEQYPEWLQKRN